MNERKFKKMIERQHVFKMREFFQKYYQYDIHHLKTGITLEDSMHEISAFQTFMDNTEFTDKSHHSLLIYRTKMERLLNQSEDPEYDRQIKILTEKYREDLEIVLEKNQRYHEELVSLNKKMDSINNQCSFYKKLAKDTQNHLNSLRSKKREIDKELDTFLEQDKQLLASITISLERLKEQQKPLKVQLSYLSHQQDANALQIEIIRKNKKAFESRLYALEHKDIIKNIINNIYPLEVEEIDRNMVFSGLALLVQDKDGVILPYANPYCLEQVEWYYHNMLGEDIREVLWVEEPKVKVLKREEDK